MRACLHVVGPDFSQRRCSEDEALGELTQAYAAALREFARARLGGLRLLPISGGIFAGNLKPQLPSLTAGALRAAFDALPERDQHAVSMARLDMCIFEEDDQFADDDVHDVAGDIERTLQTAEMINTIRACHGACDNLEDEEERHV